ncbi:MAG: 16S rRNA (guanine(966)-N(2))-methyltransferase RsmD [Actinobacteria bacterium]|nr:16S rRNA (guanine(966)-N(2))-methyltransferase RsmD [Actinomycetota bacterium]
MRIIAGAAKGRRLRAPDTPQTRPATDRVREAVFSSLGDLVAGARVADLYAGSGSYGLEALSRGAATAVFVEKGRKACETLRANISVVGLGGEMRRIDVDDHLEDADEIYDLVFIDPPWDTPATAMERRLDILDRRLASGGSVVLTRRSGEPAPEPPETWRVATDKRYGDTRILRYEKLKARP